MKTARRVLISTFGALAGVMGVEHGIGEVLQGSVAPSGVMILSWPDSAFFRILNGEPAMTVLPNLLLTGILAIFFSLLYILGVTVFIQRKHAGFVLILLSIAMLLFGGGLFPPVFALIFALAATRLQASPSQERLPRSSSFHHILRKLWPWSFAAGLLSWLCMFPGVPLLHYFFGVDNEALILTILACMFGFLPLAGWAARARDLHNRPDSQAA